MLTTLIRSIYTRNLHQDITINVYNYGSKTSIPFSTVRVFDSGEPEEISLILESPT